MLFGNNGRRKPSLFNPEPPVPVNVGAAEMEGIREALVRNALMPAPAGPQPSSPQFQTTGGLGANPAPAVNQPVVVPDVITDPEHDHGQEGHKHSADYAGHFRMHGRESNGLFAAKPKREKSFWDKIQNFALRYAAGQGDPHALMVLKSRMQERDGREKAEASFQDHNRIVGALMRQGMTADQAEIAALNVEKLGEEYNTRFRTRDGVAGFSVRTPNFDGSDKVWTAPKIVQNGADVGLFDPSNMGGASMDFDPNGGVPGLPMNPNLPPMPGMRSPIGRLSLRTEAEQYADSIAKRGTPEWRQAAQDYLLKGDGPTAYGYKDSLQDQRITSNNRNTDLRVGVDRENSIRSSETQRYTRNNTPAATVLNERGEPVLVYPDNRVTTLRNSQPMPTSRGGRGGRGGRAGTGRAAAPIAEGTVIRNPQTGQTMVRRNGQWVAR